LKQIQEETHKLYYDLFNCILTHNKSETIDYFDDLLKYKKVVKYNKRRNNKVNYISIIRDMYNQIKHDRYIGDLNDV
jgi:hypothetical protein